MRGGKGNHSSLSLGHINLIGDNKLEQNEEYQMLIDRLLQLESEVSILTAEVESLKKTGHNVAGYGQLANYSNLK
jgi:hypothetical protein